MSDKTFRDLEHEGWLSRAPSYRDLFCKITQQAIDPILDTFGDLGGKRLLDVACGTGELVASARARGARSEGVDFAATMVKEATAKYPGAHFEEGDAEQLPHGSASFDAVVCSFGLLHMQNPDRAIAEARRVLSPGGRYSFTVWCSAEQGGDFFKLVLGAIQQHGRMDVGLPPAPPIFRFADVEQSKAALTAAGFEAPATRILPLQWVASDTQDLFDLIYRGVVRTPMMLNAQTDDARAHIHQAILEGAEAYRRDGQLHLHFPALLATAVAP